MNTNKLLLERKGGQNFWLVWSLEFLGGVKLSFKVINHNKKNQLVINPTELAVDCDCIHAAIYKCCINSPAGV